jgi:hypothetical protein
MKQKEKKALTGTVIFTAFSIAAFWFMKKVLGIEGEIIYSVLIILPLVVYLVLSEKLLSFKAGKIEAVFKDAANEKVVLKSSKVEDITEGQNLDVVEKTFMYDMGKKIDNIKKRYGTDNLVLSLRFGKKNFYDRKSLINYVNSFSAFKNFSLICLIDEDDRVIASIEKEKLLLLLNNELLGTEFINIVSQGDVGKLKIFQSVVNKTIDEETNNIDALKEFDSYGVDHLVVVDKEGKLKGVVERKEILTKLMINISSKLFEKEKS